MTELGDISGIVFNRRSGHLGGGNQRSKSFDDSAELVITQRYKKPTRTGTVAEGYVLFEGEKFNYREVDWEPAKEIAAGLAANKNAGTWHAELLKEQLAYLEGFDADIDADLSMFDEDERLAAIGEAGIDEDDDIDDNGDEVNTGNEKRGVSRMLHECPKCGFTFNSQGAK